MTVLVSYVVLRDPPAGPFFGDMTLDLGGLVPLNGKLVETIRRSVSGSTITAAGGGPPRVVILSITRLDD